MAKVNFNTKKLADQVNKKATMIVRKITLDGMKTLVRQTPVDTARAKTNWSTSVENMHNQTFDEPATKTGFNRLSAPTDLRKTVGGISGYKLGQTMYLHNNLQYIVPLEYGSSIQAPKGWIRNTAKLIQKKFNEIKGLA